MTFSGRLKFYGFGFAMGLMIVFGMFGTRSCTTPNELKMQELVFQQFQLSDQAKCKLQCLHMSDKLRGENKAFVLAPEAQQKLDQSNLLLLKMELRHFEVNYDLSAPRKEPCGEYFLQPKKEFADQYNYKILVLDCDTITRINDISMTSATLACPCQ